MKASLLIIATLATIALGKGPGKTLNICEHKTASIDCGGGRIQLVSGFYGRTSKAICRHRAGKSTSCRGHGKALGIVKRKCDGKSRCSIKADNGNMGGDPCRGTVKYLQLQYTCIGGAVTQNPVPVPHNPEPIQHIRVGGRYMIKSAHDAQMHCEHRGMKLATAAQLKAAQQKGYESCACGWLAGGKVQYPMVKPRKGCGPTKPAGIRVCPKNPAAWKQAGWDAYCAAVQENVPL